MKVGIDTFGCEHGKSGQGSYLYSFMQNLNDIENIDFALFGTELDRYTYSSNNNYTYDGVNIPDSNTAERFWHHFRLKSFAKKNKYDVILYTAGARVLTKKNSIPGVAVINDVASNVFSKDENPWNEKILKNGLVNVEKIIAASNFIKNDLISLGIDSKKIKVIYNGINHSMFYPSTEIDDKTDYVNIKPFAIKRPYIIYASRMQSAAKKHIELIKAFELFKEKTNLPHRLVIAGSESTFSNEIHKVAYLSKYASDIFITGYFPHENFPELYRNSEACVFPSVNEGVGFSVLEAMACGVPVACSNACALPETTGNNALYFDSDNIQEIANSMEKIITDEDLRNKLILSGLNWVKNFSWKNTVDKTIDVLKSIL